jgi:AsnC-like helix-turn-helix protein
MRRQAVWRKRYGVTGLHTLGRQLGGMFGGQCRSRALDSATHTSPIRSRRAVQHGSSTRMDRRPHRPRCARRRAAPPERFPDNARRCQCVQTLDGVVESYRVTGPDRLVLKIVARSVADLDEVIQTLAHYGTPTASIVLSSQLRPVRVGVKRPQSPSRPTTVRP